MDGYLSNSKCILDYQNLFRILADEHTDKERCQALWRTILQREQASGSVRLAPLLLRQRFQLRERDFLLVMAALALELDGGTRNAFRRKYGMDLPTIEYGLHLISPLCPSGYEILAELAGPNVLCDLLFTAAEPTAYLLERPLILCRMAAAFLAGLTMAQVPGCTLWEEGEEQRLPLHNKALEQVCVWYGQRTGNPLYLCGPIGSGRRTLLRRACGNVVYCELDVLADASPAGQNRALRETAALALLLDAPVCAAPDGGRRLLRNLERICREYGIFLAVLAEEGEAPENAKEAVWLPRRLTVEQRWEAWRFFVPSFMPDAVPRGAGTVGALKEIAALAVRIAAGKGRKTVKVEDTRRAMLRRGGALGNEKWADAALEDMVLSDGVREQLERVCYAAANADKLAAWNIPRQKEGVTAVFYGPSGTGKTMAASAVANRLGMPLLRADLAQIIDKYVGETEKHLSRLLRRARENGCVLLFDEADALFSRRTAVSTGHDRYANLSTAYLLQEIERYDGVVILCTNLLDHFDGAFLRRLQYIVPFGQPDAELREKLWRKALPPERCAEDLSCAALAQTALSPAEIFAVARRAAGTVLMEGRRTVNSADILNALPPEAKKTAGSLPKFLAERDGIRRKGGSYGI